MSTNPFDMVDNRFGDAEPRLDQREWKVGELAEVIRTHGGPLTAPPQRVRIIEAWWGRTTGHRMVKVVDVNTEKEYTTFGDNLKLYTPAAPAPAPAPVRPS